MEKWIAAKPTDLTPAQNALVQAYKAKMGAKLAAQQPTRLTSQENNRLNSFTKKGYTTPKKEEWLAIYQKQATKYPSPDGFYEWLAYDFVKHDINILKKLIEKSAEWNIKEPKILMGWLKDTAVLGDFGSLEKVFLAAGKNQNKVSSFLTQIKGQNLHFLNVVNNYCSSCQDVIKQFNTAFPNVNLILIDNIKKTK